MEGSDTPIDGPSGGDDTAAASFEGRALDDREALLEDTYDRLAGAGVEFEPTDEFFDRLEAAFDWAYMAEAGKSGLPPHVRLAVDDALAVVREAFADRPDADLRTEVLPAFTRQVAGFDAAYRSGR